jgi:putative sterol carrier protein
MPDQTTEFFESLRRRAYEPLLERGAGTLRFDIEDDGSVAHWFVSVDKGDVGVSRARRRADCTVRAPKAVFDGLVSGEVNATAAALRGAVVVEGNAELLTLFQRVLPGPPSGGQTR